MIAVRRVYRAILVQTYMKAAAVGLVASLSPVRSDVVVRLPSSLATSAKSAPTTRSYAYFGPLDTNYNVTGPAAYFTGSELCEDTLDASSVAARVVFSDLNTVQCVVVEHIRFQSPLTPFVVLFIDNLCCCTIATFALAAAS